MKADKIISVQILRAFACLIVLLLHFFSSFLKINFNGALGVDLFFVISGYIIAASITRLPVGNKSGIFFINRFARVAPYYYLITLLFLIMSAFILKELVNINHVVVSILFIPHAGDPVLFMGWTLLHELFFYTFVALLLRFTGSVLKITLIYLSFLCAIRFVPDWIYIITFIKASTNFTFIYGLIIYLCYDKIIELFKKPVIQVVSLIIFLLVLMYSSDIPLSQQQLRTLPAIGYYFRDIGFLLNINYGVPRALLLGLPAALLFATILSFESVLKEQGHTILVKLGNCSYSIYLIQAFGLALINHFQIKSLPLVITIFMLTIVVSIYMNKTEIFLGRVTKKVLQRAFLKHPMM
jgi:exopolysaccharide production protein ExoZ